MKTKYSPSLQPRPTANSSGRPMPASMPPTRMKGRLRPQRVRVLSEIQPNSASDTPSTMIFRKMTVEISPGATPRKTLKTWKTSEL